MLDMGFKPQVDRLVRKLRDDRQTMFFSATLDGEVGELARRYTHFPARFEGELPADRRSGDIDHRFVPVTNENKVSTLVELLNDDERGLVLVFVRTKAGADRLVEKLRRHDVDAIAIHGDKGQAQREQALAHFDTGKVKTLVATDVAARGLDVDDITHVINFDPPEEPDVYTHRVGRTGRAGKGGVGITLVLPEQQADVSRVARLQGHVEKFEETGMQVAKPRRRLHVAPPGRPLQVVEGEQLTEKQAEALREELAGARRPAPQGGRSRRSRRRVSSAISPRTSSTTPRRTSRGCSRRASARCARGSMAPRSSRTRGADEVGIGSVVDVEGDGGQTMTVEISAVGGAGTVSPTSPLGSALLGKKVGDSVDVQAPEGAWQRDDQAHPLSRRHSDGRVLARPGLHATLGPWRPARSSAASVA